MSRVKRTFVLALLIAFTLWPAVHLTLVRVYGVNPWKLGGWGMYAVPQLQPSVRVFGLTASSQAPRSRPSTRVDSMPKRGSRSSTI